MGILQKGTFIHNGSKRVKYPRYRPTWPRVVQVKAPSQISRHSAHEGGKLPLRTGRLYLQKYPGTHGRMLREKSSMTRPGIDPGTFPLVAQRLNHYAAPGPAQVIGPPDSSILQFLQWEFSGKSLQRLQVYCKNCNQIQPSCLYIGVFLVSETRHQLAYTC